MMLIPWLFSLFINQIVHTRIDFHSDVINSFYAGCCLCHALCVIHLKKYRAFSLRRLYTYSAIQNTLTIFSCSYKNSFSKTPPH